MTDRSPEQDRDPAQFQRAREIFEAALAQPPAERDRLVESACGDDVVLASDVQAMLRADAAPHRWLDGRVLLAADRLESGEVIAEHLQIIEPIGSGGMGEVYRAHDTRLGRDVAVKVLPPSVGTAEQADRLARFRREAQVLASLNHPNIAAIHGLEDSDGVHALVLELIDGPTLADRIAAGPIPVDRVVAIARQIAEALEAAHERGIVHRDLKPANIKLRPDGTVKLLDFGLAKVLTTDIANSGDGAASPTLTSPSLIARGVIFGTPAYLSPEQARGDEADRRSDIWAFGAVLYEMLSGRRAFQGENAADTIAAVLRQEVEWSAVDPSTPDRIRRLLGRCLDRDVRRRLRDIGEARIVLEDADEATNTGAVARPLKRDSGTTLAAHHRASRSSHPDWNSRGRSRLGLHASGRCARDAVLARSDRGERAVCRSAIARYRRDGGRHPHHLQGRETEARARNYSCAASINSSPLRCRLEGCQRIRLPRPTGNGSATSR